MPKKINYLFRLAGAIIKHQLGDGTLAISAEYLSEYAGEEIAEKIENYIKRQDIEAAFKRADTIFEENCSDHHLKQAIHEFPLAGSPTLLALAKKLPKTYDSEKLLIALTKTLRTYWGEILSEDQTKQAAFEYRSCLERSFAATGQEFLAIIPKLERIEVNTSEILKNQFADQARNESLRTSMELLRHTINERLPIPNQPRPARFPDAGLDIELLNLDKDELQLNAQLDQCKFLIDEGNPNASNKSLNHIEQSMRGKNISNKIWFRLKTLQGGCALALFNDARAAAFFEEAYRLDSSSAKAISNLSIARLIQKKFTEAITLSEHAFEIDSNESGAYAVWVAARAQIQGFKNLQDLVKPDYFNRPEYLRTLGLVFFDAGEHAQAIEYLRRALTLDNTNRYTKLSLITVLITYETSNNKASSRYLVQDKREIGNSTKEAITLIDELIADVEAGDNTPIKLEAKALRAALKGIKGDRAGAKEDCDEVLKQDPNQVNALCNRIIIARIENDLDYLLILAERIPSKVFSDDVQMVHLLVSAYVQKKYIDKALALTEKYCGTYRHLSDNYECTAIRAWSLFVAGREQAARDLIAELMNNPVDFVLALENAALFENLIGSISQAIIRLEEMYPNVAADQKRNIALKLASLYQQNQDLAKAIEWLDVENIDITESLELARSFIPALFELQQLERAFRACQKVREYGIKEPALLEIEAHLAEILGDLGLAYELDMELVRMDAGQVQHQVNLARLCMRSDQEAEATSILISINREAVQNPYFLMQLSQMYMLIDEAQKALDTMYLARRLGMDLPKIHEAYLSLFLHVDDEIENLHPDVVSIGTSVYLTCDEDEQEKWISISDDKNIDTKAWEFSPTSDIAKLLMGRKSGASIELDPNQVGKPKWIIQEIQSKYLRAFQEILSEFNIRFPKNTSLQKISVENEDVTPLLTQVAGKSVRTRRILDLYKQGQFTIEQLSLLIGHNRLDTFLGLLVDENTGPYASLGSTEDQQYQKSVIRNANEVTIDLTTLWTFSYLQMLDLLRKRFSKIFVPQHLVDEINEILIHRKFELKKGYSTIGYDGNNFYFIEVPKDQIENSIKQLVDMKSFIQANCIVTSVLPKYVDQVAQIVRGNRNNGLSSSSATMIIAAQTETPLLADDAQLRTISQGYLKVPGFWSQIFLDDLKTRKMISPETHADACIKLMLAGYRYTSVNLEMISLTLGKYNYATNRYTLAVINALRPDTTESTAIDFAALVIADLWSGPTPIDLKLNMLDNFLRALTAGRVSDIVLFKLTEILRRLLPDSQSKEVVQQIALYAKVVRQMEKN